MLNLSNALSPLSGLSPGQRFQAMQNFQPSPAPAPVAAPAPAPVAAAPPPPAAINPETISPSAVTDPMDSLRAFMQTPEYQFLNMSGDPSTFDPTVPIQERFQADPAYQFQQEEGIRNLMQQHAASGLLESGASLRDVLGFSQNLASQSYGDYYNRQQGLFSNYQNRLQGLASMGPGVVGAEGARQAGQQRAGIQQNLGQNLLQAALGQGSAGLGAYTGTGAAQAANVMQGAGMQSQIGNVNQQAQAGLAGGMQSMLGSLGSSYLQGGGGSGGFF